MNVEMLRQRRIPTSVAIAAFAVILVLTAVTAGNMLGGTPRPATTHEGSSASSPMRLVPQAPWLLSRIEARLLVRRGATPAELAAENQQRWQRLQLRMLQHPWVVGVLRHRPGMTLFDLVGVTGHRRWEP